jgi:hypothetical protein
MNRDDSKELYVMLGINHPQRINVLCQMLEYLVFNGIAPSVLVCKDLDIDKGNPVIDRIISKGVDFLPWSLNTDSGGFSIDGTPGEVSILLAPGDTSVIDVMEVLSKQVTAGIWELQRVITWVHSEYYANDSDSKRWYEACFHFSDLVILDCFKNMEQSALGSIKAHFHDESLPCILVNTKKDRLQELGLVMDNQARRITQVFDRSAESSIDYEVEIEEGDEEDDIDAALPETNIDPYFERNHDGRRSKPLPNPKLS